MLNKYVVLLVVLDILLYVVGML